MIHATVHWKSSDKDVRSTVTCEFAGDRIELTGRAVTVLEARLLSESS